jgi:RHS repeat-associated protein
MRAIRRFGPLLVAALVARSASALCGPYPELAAEGPDVVLSAEIRARAAALAFDPVRIYEFVRNEFEYQPYYGLMRGPEETLRGRRGNEYDLSALLVSLLRVSEDADGNCVLSASEDKNGNGQLDGGTRARFVRGRISIAGPDAVAWTRAGSPQAAVEFWGWTEPFAWFENPALGVRLVDDRVERMHVWVEAEVPVAHYRGSGLGGTGLAWLALDPSFKRKVLQAGIASSGFSGVSQFVGQYRQELPLEYYERSRRQSLASSQPGKSLADLPRDGPIEREAPGVLPTALPYVATAIARQPSLASVQASDPYRWSLEVARCSTVWCDAIAGVWSVPIPDVRGRPILVHSTPTNPTVTNPTVTTSICSAYSGTFAPKVSMGGSSVALGMPANCGLIMPIRLSIRPPLPLAGWPAELRDIYPNTAVGGIYAVALDTNSVDADRVRVISRDLMAARELHPLTFDANGQGYVERNGQAGKQADELFYVADFVAQNALTGGLLHLAGAHYMKETRAAFHRTAGYGHRLLQHLPWAGLVQAGPTSAVLADTPFLVRPQQLLIDIRGVSVGLHSQANGEPVNLFEGSSILGALEASAREHTTWEELASFEALSTVKALQVRGEQGGAGEILDVRTWNVEEILAEACEPFALQYRCVDVAGEPDDLCGLVPGIPAPDVINNTGLFPYYTCPDLDLETYCQIKNEVVFGNVQLGRLQMDLPRSLPMCWSFDEQDRCVGPTTVEFTGDDPYDFYLGALYWDYRQMCPPPPNPVPAADSLVVARRSSFEYQNWVGSASFSFGTWVQWPVRDPDVETPYISASIAPAGAPSAGGGIVMHGANAVYAGGNMLTPQGGSGSYSGSVAMKEQIPLVKLFKTSPTPQLFVGERASYAGDPVNVFTGNYYQSDIDLEVPGRGGHALKLVRAYNSSQEYSGPLGLGWTHTFDQHLRLEPNAVGDASDDELVWVAENGGETPFAVVSTTKFTAPEWSHDTLSRASAAAPYEIVTKTGMTYRFHPLVGERAHLDRIIDRNGNAIVCEYADPQNPTRLTGVLDTAGRRLAFTYAGAHLSAITDWTGRTWEYTVNPAGNLEEFRNPAQVAADEPGVLFEYYGDLPGTRVDHNIRRITQPEDRDGDGSGDVSIEFVYYLNGAVESHTDSLGRTTSFTYNVIRRRTTVTHPDGAEEHYMFDGEGNVTRHESPRGVVHEYAFEPASHDRTSETDGLGFRTTASYDDDGNMIERVDRIESPKTNPKKETWTYNEFSQPLSYVDRLGARREWSYDVRGNLLEERAVVNGAMRVLRRHEYDDFGNRTKSTALLEEDGSRPRTTRFFYAANGVDLVRSLDANVHEVRFTPDELSRVRKVETTRSVAGSQAKGIIVAETEYDVLSRPVKATDTAGTVRRTVFDQNGNVEAALTFVPNPAAPGAEAPATVAACQAAAGCRVDVRNTFDRMDQLVTTTNALGETTQTELDLRGRPMIVRTPLGHETRFEYDLDGNRIRTVDPTGAESIAIYDAEDRVIETRDALGRRTTTSYDREGRVLQVVGPGNITHAQVIEYDAEGRPLRASNAIAVENQAAFDELGRRTLLREAVGKLDGQGVSLEAETRFVYDLEGRLVEKTDPLGRNTRVHYDVLGRLSEVRTPLGHATRFSYDEIGNRILVESPTGETLHFEYDARGLVTRRYSTGSDPALAIDDTYGYDGLGRLTVARTASGITRLFDYDALGRVVAMHDPAIGTVRQVFDADGRVVQIGYPDGRSVHYGYSARGEVTSVRDPSVASLTTPLDDWQLAYDAIGRPVRERDPFGVERRTTYTEAGFVDAVELHSATALVERYAYSGYDALGNPGQIVSGEGTTAVQYDARSRVEKVAYPGGSLAACLTACERFQYDKAGNRTLHVENGIARQYVVDADDRLTAILGPAPELPIEFEHDAAGRRTSRSQSAGWSYTYDALGRLRAFDVNGFSGTLEYTATDERTLRTDAAGTSRYLGEWYETSAASTRRLVHGPGVDNVLGQVSGTNQVRTLLRDGTANVVRHPLDGSMGANTVRRWEAFGGLRSGVQPVERGFAGRPVEGTTSGLVNVRARHYDPQTGRFLQPDPLGIAADQLYAYAANDPYRFWDPTGLRPGPLSSRQPSLGGAIASIAAGVAEAAASIFVPYAGEGLDAITLANPNAAGWERAVAGVSLSVGIATVGISPNASGVIHGAGRVGEGVYDVYQIVGSEGVRYVGITTDFVRRSLEHSSKYGAEFTMERVVSGISKIDARGVEQVMIEHYGRIADRAGRDLDGQLDNLINSISPARDYYQEAVRRGRDILRDAGIQLD